MSKRDKIIKFKVNDDEYEKIMQKFRLSRGTSRSRFIRQMILEGMVIVFTDDIAEIKEEMNKIWRQLNYFQSLLRKLKP